MYLVLTIIFNPDIFFCFSFRAVVEQAFDKYSELDQILKFSTPKVLRLVEILRQVRPLNFVDPRKRRDRLEVFENGKAAAALEGSEDTQENKTSSEDKNVEKDK